MNEKDEDNIDGCDIEIRDEDITDDTDLPVIEGGVAEEQNEDDIDGCDAPIHESDATSDEELPTAEGGVN